MKMFSLSEVKPSPGELTPRSERWQAQPGGSSNLVKEAKTWELTYMKRNPFQFQATFDLTSYFSFAINKTKTTGVSLCHEFVNFVIRLRLARVPPHRSHTPSLVLTSASRKAWPEGLQSGPGQQSQRQAQHRRIQEVQL